MMAADRPKTVGILRQDHLALMMHWRELPDDNERAGKAGDLRQCVKEAGQDIDDRTERDEAQGIIDYWASAIASLPGQSYPPILTLDPYLGEAARRAGDSARLAFDALATEEERRIVRALFEDLFILRPDGQVERGPPRTRAVLQQSIGGQGLDSVLERFVETGAVARLVADTPQADRFEAADPRVVEDWPALREWLEERGAYYLRRSRLMTLAERWRAGNRDAALLARGRELQTIDRFLDETDLLDAFIEASKRASRRAWSVRSVLLGVAVTICLGLGWQSYIQLRSVSAAGESAEALEKRVDSLAAVASASSDSREAVLTRQAGALAQIAGGSDAAQLSPVRYMWIGDDRTTNLRDPASGNPVLPRDVRPGERYQATAHIALRASLPSPPNRSAALVGAVRPGAVVKALAVPELWPQSGQYWLRVEPPTLVYIQFASGDPSPLRNLLARAGFDVPLAERLDSADGLTEVRYCWKSDEEAAEAVGSLVDRARQASTPRRWIGENRACQRVSSPGTVEVWIDDPDIMASTAAR